MRKIVIITSVFMLFVGVCGQTMQKQVAINNNIEDTLTTIDKTDLVDEEQKINESQLSDEKQGNAEKKWDYNLMLTILFGIIAAYFARKSYKLSLQAKHKDNYDSFIINRTKFKKEIYPCLTSLKIKKLDDISFSNIKADIVNLQKINENLDSNIEILTKINIFHPMIETMQQYINELIIILKDTTQDDLEKNTDNSNHIQRLSKYSDISAKYSYLYYNFWYFLQPKDVPILYAKVEEKRDRTINDFDIFLDYHRSFPPEEITKKFKIESLQDRIPELENMIKRTKTFIREPYDFSRITGFDIESDEEFKKIKEQQEELNQRWNKHIEDDERKLKEIEEELNKLLNDRV